LFKQHSSGPTNSAQIGFPLVATHVERSKMESRSACPAVRELGLGGMKNIALVPGIGEASFILLMSGSRFRDDRSIHGKVLPSPAMVGIRIKPPD
jgi:hypothetical protein